jgi:hypothetical protein
VTTSQREFDEQILVLTKLLVDSLNEQALASHAVRGDKSEKGIQKLNRFLEKIGLPQKDAVVQFLRDLQELRSAGSAHRKGDRYEKLIARLGISSRSGPEMMERCLLQATAVLRLLLLHLPQEGKETRRHSEPSPT